jgi:hypothetical protein
MCPFSLLMDILSCVVGGLLSPRKGILHEPQPQRQSYGEACQGGQRDPRCSQEGKEEDHGKDQASQPYADSGRCDMCFHVGGSPEEEQKKVTGGKLVRDDSVFDAFAEFETPESGAEASPATS